uniref:THAP domain-containing protein 1 n=1 Tax=Cyprinus carpio TaxID=7962 RepID=A0A8C2Q5W2_CYPCA
MVITCIVKGCDNKEKVYSAVMFHRIPTHHIQRRAWLAALNKNPKTPLMTLKKWHVCSEHFTPEDYTCTGTRLKDEATPTIFKSLTQQSGSSPNAQDLPEQEENFFVGVPHSTPQKHRAEDATSVFDVSMTSEPAVDTADTSFVLNSSPSTTTTGSSSSISGQARGWKERKWIVNESKLLELFQKCTTCGAAMCDLNQTVTQFGSRININWQCSNGHMGQWESCPNILSATTCGGAVAPPKEMQRYPSMQKQLITK